MGVKKLQKEGESKNLGGNQEIEPDLGKTLKTCPVLKILGVDLFPGFFQGITKKLLQLCADLAKKFNP